VRARRAELRHVDAIGRVCSKGWRDTYAGLYSSQEIEQVIDRFYSAQRIREEVESPDGWDGWGVAEDDAGGAREHWVSVEPENEKGLPFYRARGFVERGQRLAGAREGIVLRLWRAI
jgi:hypothetical protein